ncbi:helix-turn-helix transcriptional regulator [Clostridium perfringens]|uniref:helix-turn-helix transcriptional regulator n=1 Tax=Clostridium perfringens TaxID=1502 RepID=UPI0024BD0020|nr:helix-turn-helix transcriptional regulator [Clostridium perfringens]
MKNSPIKLRRLNKSMEVEEVAKLLGIKKEAMYKLECGLRKVTVPIAVKLSKIYKCSIEDICKDFGIDTKVNWDIWEE